MEKKKGSDHFRNILNPYGEKSNYGKIGRRRRLSKLNVLFFSIILSVTIGATPIKIITFLCFASLVGRNADCTIHESRMAPSVHNGLHPTCNPKVLLVLQGTKHSHSHATATSAFRPSSKGHALCGTLRSSVAPLPAHPHRCNELLVAAPLRPCAQA